LVLFLILYRAGEVMEDFIKYGQWVVVIISLLGITLVSSTKPKTRLSGYIVTALGRLSGAILFVFLDLYAFVIVNIIHTFIGIRGYIKNKKEGV
jgi:hypothetical protein